MSETALHDDAVALLRDWRPPAEAADDWRATLKLLAEGPDVMWRAHDGGHITASAVIVAPERDRVLLCLHGKFNIWVQVGGHCEPADATLAAAALREATEESGIAGLTIDPDPVDLDIHDVTCAGRACRHHDVIFAVYAPPGATEAVSAESHALGWFDLAHLPAPIGTDTDRMVRHALLRARAAR